jgi:hypothetical protein
MNPASFPLGGDFIKGAYAFLRRAVMTGIATSQCIIPSGLTDPLRFFAGRRKMQAKSVRRPRLLYAGTGPPDFSGFVF